MSPIALCGLVLVMAFRQQASDPGVVAAIELSQSASLIGLPVVVKFNVTNHTTEAVRLTKAQLGDTWSSIVVDISRDGVNFERCAMGTGNPDRIRDRMATLEANCATSFELRIHYSRDSTTGLAFDRPEATFYVKASIPIIARGLGMEIETNVVPISIKAPSGVDADVWQQIQGRDVAFFLHCGDIRNGDHHTFSIATNVLERYPESSYTAPILDALKRHYSRRLQQGRGADPLVDRRLQDLLGIKDRVKPFFATDHRLDVIVKIPAEAPLGQVLKSISKQSGVPLDASDEFKLEEFSDEPRAVELRAEMESMEGEEQGRVWVRRGNGYFLERSKAAKPKTIGPDT